MGWATYQLVQDFFHQPYHEWILDNNPPHLQITPFRSHQLEEWVGSPPFSTAKKYTNIDDGSFFVEDPFFKWKTVVYLYSTSVCFWMLHFFCKNGANGLGSPIHHAPFLVPISGPFSEHTYWEDCANWPPSASIMSMSVSRAWHSETNVAKVCSSWSLMSSTSSCFRFSLHLL